MVGTPTNWVMCSRSISSRARSGFHLYMSTSLVPAATAFSMTATQPVTWNSGTTRMNEVGQGAGSVGGNMTTLAVARQPKAMMALTTARCVETAPLG